MLVPKVESLVGMEVYATGSRGIGGVIKQSIEDFVVEEVLVDGSTADVAPNRVTVQHSVLHSRADRDRYLLCVLVKRNWDNLSAIKAIADQLRISPSQVHIAGIKDAKAVTAQHITLERTSQENVANVHVRDMQVRPIGYLRHKLSSYYLLGNNFHVTLRAVNLSRTTIKRRIAATAQAIEAMGGIPNFFGHQRFGTTRPITHMVGKALLGGNARKAAMLFLAKSSLQEHPESRIARDQLKATHDFRRALKDFPKQLRYERLMLRHLVRRPDDFVGAFRRLPMKLQELFAQALQAHLFNGFLSKRIERSISPSEATVGDWVVNVERTGLPMATARKTVTAQTLGEINKGIKSGKLQLALPLVGFKQRLSQGTQGEIEKQVLEEEAVSLADFRALLMPEIALRGGVRASIAPVKELNVESVEPDSRNMGKYAINLSFELLRGSYATVLLRELMKSRNPVKSGF